MKTVYSLLCTNVQVFSESVSKPTGGSEIDGKAKFILMLDKFFDCLNVTNFTNKTRHRKLFLHPYRHERDVRLKVMNNYNHTKRRVSKFIY